MKYQFLALLLFAGVAVASCTSEKQNVISGKVDGLQVGDKIILLVQNTDGTRWVPTDSTTVNKDGEFTLNTKVTGCDVQLAYKDDRALCFLEDYAELRATGSADRWNLLKFAGGIYSHPDISEAFSLMDSAMFLQDEGYLMRVEARKTNDTAKLTEGSKLMKKARTFFSDADSINKEFVKKHPESTYSANILWWSDLRDDVNKLEEAFNLFAPEVQKSITGVRIKNYITNTKASRVGAVAPDFTLTALDGQTVSLTSYRGKHILLYFWSPYCGWTPEANAMMIKLYNKLQSKNIELEIIGIAFDEEDDSIIKGQVEADTLPWAIHINDTNSPDGKAVIALYAIMSTPIGVLISPKGEILYNDNMFEVIPKIEELFTLNE